MKLHRLKFFFSLVISCNPQLGRQIINRNHLVTSALNVITTPTIALELCSTYLGQISPWLAHRCVMTSQKWWHGSVYDVTRLQKSQIFHQWCNCSYNSILTEFAVAGKSMNSEVKSKLILENQWTWEKQSKILKWIFYNELWEESTYHIYQ